MSDGLRPPRDEDLPTVVRLQGEHSPEPVDAEMVIREWTSPGVELEHDARIEDDAYCLVEDLYEGRAWIEVQGRPSGAMLDWAEARASDKGARLSPAPGRPTRSCSRRSNNVTSCSFGMHTGWRSTCDSPCRPPNGRKA